MATAEVYYLTKKIREWIELSGYDIEKIKYHKAIENGGIWILKVTGKKDIKYYGVDKEYPYMLVNPFNINVKK